jgi:hypothetical protein
VTLAARLDAGRRDLRGAANPFSLVAMRWFAAIALLVASLLAATLTTTQAARLAATPSWTPANFRGLSLGRAQRSEVVRLLGSPDSASRGHDGEELFYKSRGSHKGDLTVRLNRFAVATEVQESFPVAIPRTILYKEFGQDALTAHFSRAKCAADVLYRDPRGNIELSFYPSRGIVLWPDQYGYDFAAVLYVAQQPGLARAPACVKKP